MNDSTARCPDGLPPRLITLSHASGIRLTLMDWGGTWLSCTVPVGGAEREVLLACGNLNDQMTQTAYLGATVGRFANRIGKAQFPSGTGTVKLVANEKGNQLHGGVEGFDKRRWSVLEQSAERVLLGLDSPDGDQGFPGNLRVTVCYSLEGGSVSMVYEACVNAPCPVSLTNHAYFNLDGAASDVRQHRLQLVAGQYLPVGADSIPLGKLADVAGTSFDFREPKAVARDFLTDEQQALVGGYDHAYLLDPACRTLEQPAATLTSGNGDLAMDLYTTMPSLQFYSGNYLAGIPARAGGVYQAHQGLALEPQYLPDSPNHPEWPQPDCWLKPGETRRHSMRLAFRVR